jgi:hypothetical protein
MMMGLRKKQLVKKEEEEFDVEDTMTSSSLIQASPLLLYSTVKYSTCACNPEI